MSKTQKSPTPARHWNWKYLAVAGGCTVAIIAVCVAVRVWWGGAEATAQAPVIQANQTPAAPVANQVPRRQTPVAAAKPKVVAVVNGESITREHLANETVRRYGKDVVENLVNKHLILQACQTQGIQITAQEVEAEISRMAGKFGLSSERWLEMLRTERDINPQQYRNDIIWPTLALRKLAAEKLEVSREELLREWESQHGEKRQVRMVMIKDKDRCEQVRQYLLANPDEFGAKAKDYSEDKPSASARGLIPPVRKHVGEPAIEKAVYALKEGEISDLVFVSDHYFFFKCEKVIEAQRFDPATQQQAEAALRDQLQEKKLREAGTVLFKELQEKARVVNVFNDPQLRLKMPGVAATINGQQLTMEQLAEECVTRHGTEVLEGEINRVLLTQQLKQAGKTVTNEDLNEEVAAAALMYGFVKADGSADVDAWLKKVLSEDDATLELYLQDAVWPSVALKKIVDQSVEVTEADLQKGYEANYGDQVEVLVCVLGSQRRAQEVWEMAQANGTEKFFGDLAYQYSIEPTSKYNFGKVPPIRKHSGQPSVEAEAFRLKPGELSSIVAIGDKFVVMRCIGHKKSEAAPEYAAVKQELHSDIFEKKLRLAMSKRFDQIRVTAQIHNVLTGARQTGKEHASRVQPASAVKTVPVPGIAPAQRGTPGRRFTVRDNSSIASRFERLNAN